MSQDQKLQERLEAEVNDFRQVVNEIEQLVAKREQIRGRVQLLEKLIEEKDSVETVSGEVVD